MKKGFTLIELLVVVLIIGILAAVALPQYETAVLRTKFATILPLGRSIKEAQERYYLANNEYAAALADLDIGLPGNCTAPLQGSGNMWYCGDEWFVNNAVGNGKANGVLVVTYCPGADKTDFLSCDSKREAEIYFYYRYATKYGALAGQTRCTSYTEKGQKVCKTFKGLLRI